MQRSLVALFVSIMLVSSLALAQPLTQSMNDDDIGSDTLAFNDNTTDNIGASNPNDSMSGMNSRLAPTKGDRNDYSDMNPINPDPNAKSRSSQDGMDADTATGDDDY